MGGMTDSRERIDPRYDPRFQRGYVGGEADAPPHADSPTPSSPVVAPVPVTREPRERVESRPIRSQPEPVPAGEPAREPARESAPDPVPARDAAAQGVLVPVAAEVAPTLAPDPDPDPDSGPGPQADPLDAFDAAALVRGWLIAGWAVTVGAVALGAWMSWTVNSDSGLYFGRIDPSAEILRTLGWSLSPALLMAGVFGAVVVTGLAALLQDAARRRDSEPRADAGGFRRTPAWWALVAIAAGGLVLIAWSVNLTTEGNAASSQFIYSDDGGTVSDAQQATFTKMALGQFAQTMIGPLAFAVIAAFVAVVVVEVQRLSARRAR